MDRTPAPESPAEWDAKTPAALGAQPMRRTSRMRLARPAYRRLISAAPAGAPGRPGPVGSRRWRGQLGILRPRLRPSSPPPDYRDRAELLAKFQRTRVRAVACWHHRLRTTHRRVRRRRSRLRERIEEAGPRGGVHGTMSFVAVARCRADANGETDLGRRGGYLRMVRRFMTRFGVALSVAAVVLSLGASAALGGEITGNGKSSRRTCPTRTQIEHGAWRLGRMCLLGPGRRPVRGRPGYKPEIPPMRSRGARSPRTSGTSSPRSGPTLASPATRRRASRSSGATLSTYR